MGVKDLPPKFRYVELEQDVSDDGADLTDSQPNLEAMKHILNVDVKPLLPLDGIDLKAYLADLEQHLIQQALDEAKGVVARAADKLQMRRTTLVEKMRKYDLNRQAVS